MRWIFHVDMDAFFASIEQRDDPSLVGKPVIVGGARRRGVVAAASYEVRRYGVHSAMPIAQALRRCPHAVVIPPNIAKYATESEKIMEVLHSYSPSVEPLSFDEAFLDMTGTEALFGAPQAVAVAIKRDVAEATGLTCSVGAAPNKFLAKLASDFNKPDGITVIPHGEEASFIAPLPVRRIWGVGTVTEAKLLEQGFATIGDVAAAPAAELVRRFGKSLGAHLSQLSHGVDTRPVASRARRSVGSESTLDNDIRGRDAVDRELRSHCESVARHLRAKQLVAGGVRVKVRFTETFALQTRQTTVPTPTADGSTLYEHARRLLHTLDLDHPIRLVGAAAYDLEAADDVAQLSLFGARSDQLNATLDAIRSKFGDKISRGV